MANDIDELLNAPCMCCSYNGPGYWQSGTHHDTCPFLGISGVEDRKEFIVLNIGEALQQWYWDITPGA